LLTTACFELLSNISPNHAGVEPWMFPWERRQLRGDGTGLQTWEKLYWGVFVTAISVFLFSRLAGPKAVAEEDPVSHS